MTYLGPQPRFPDGSVAWLTPEHNRWLELMNNWPAGSVVAHYQGNQQIVSLAAQAIETTMPRVFTEAQPRTAASNFRTPAFFSPEHNAWVERRYGLPAGRTLEWYHRDRMLMRAVRNLIFQALERTERLPTYVEAMLGEEDEDEDEDRGEWLPRYRDRDQVTPPRTRGSRDRSASPPRRASRSPARGGFFRNRENPPGYSQQDEYRRPARLSASTAGRAPSTLPRTPTGIDIGDILRGMPAEDLFAIAADYETALRYERGEGAQGYEDDDVEDWQNGGSRTVDGTGRLDDYFNEPREPRVVPRRTERSLSQGRGGDRTGVASRSRSASRRRRG